jgi:hypothetical protein
VLPRRKSLLSDCRDCAVSFLGSRFCLVVKMLFLEPKRITRTENRTLMQMDAGMPSFYPAFS